MSGEDFDRVSWCWTEPCYARALSPCSGGMTAHHAGKKPGMKIKTNDDSAVPLCARHHQQLEAAAPPFRDMGGEGRQALEVEWIDKARARYARPMPAWF